MRCPQCKTENRDDRATCYHCCQDLRPLARVLNRARNHYNSALEHAERDRLEEAKRELQNALDLDSSFVNAWLVLGTVNARMDNFEEARAAWQKALALDTRFEKAHDYLAKAERVEPYMPALRNLKALAAALFFALLIVLIVAAGAIFYLARPDRAMDHIELALQYQAAGEWGEAMRQLESAEEAALAPESSRQVAAALREQMNERLNERVAEIESLVQTGNLDAAMNAIETIQARHPFGGAAEQVSTLKSRVLDQVVERAQAAVRDFRQGEIGAAELTENFQRWLAWLEDDGRREQVAELFGQVQEEGQRRLLAEIQTEVAAMEDPAEAIRTLSDYAARYPDLRSELEELQRAQLSAAAERLLIQMDAALAENDPIAARQRLVDLRELYRTFGLEPPAERIAAAERRLRQEGNRQTLEQLEEAYAAQDFERVIGLTAELEREDWTEQSWSRVQELRDEARRRLADELWEWTQRLDPLFEGLLISREQARRLIRWHELIMEEAPAAEEAFRSAVTLYRTSTAYLKMGEVREAMETIERLRREYPNASVLDWPSFRRYIQRLEAAAEDTEEAAA